MKFNDVTVGSSRKTENNRETEMTKITVNYNSYNYNSEERRDKKRIKQSCWKYITRAIKREYNRILI